MGEMGLTSLDCCGMIIFAHEMFGQNKYLQHKASDTIRSPSCALSNTISLGKRSSQCGSLLSGGNSTIVTEPHRQSGTHEGLLTSADKRPEELWSGSIVPGDQLLQVCHAWPRDAAPQPRQRLESWLLNVVSFKTTEL